MATYPTTAEVQDYCAANPGAMADALEQLSDYDKETTLISVYASDALETPKALVAFAKLAEVMPGAKIKSSGPSIVREATDDELLRTARGRIASQMYAERAAAEKEEKS